MDIGAFDLLFYLFAVVALISAMGVIVARNPVYSALSLVVTLISLAALYLLLQAEFLAVVQVLTYAGAILVLFVFIIMLLNLSESELFESSWGNVGKSLLTLVGVVAFVTLGFMVHYPKLNAGANAAGFGEISTLGREIFTRYVIPFEIAGVLLTVALIGAVMLAKKHLTKD